MNDLIQIEGVADAISESRDSLVVMVFSKSPSQFYKQAIGIASGASAYKEYAVEKIVIHKAVFSRTADQAARAITLLRYVEGWSGLQLFIAGRLHTGPAHALRAIIECYQAAAHCNDHRAYCLHLSDVPFKREYDELPSINLLAGNCSPKPKQIRFFIPCRFLPDRRFIEKSLNVKWEDQIQALAIQQGVDWCPNFDLSEFKQLE